MGQAGGGHLVRSSRTTDPRQQKWPSRWDSGDTSVLRALGPICERAEDTVHGRGSWLVSAHRMINDLQRKLNVVDMLLVLDIPFLWYVCPPCSCLNYVRYSAAHVIRSCASITLFSGPIIVGNDVEYRLQTPASSLACSQTVCTPIAARRFLKDRYGSSEPPPGTRLAVVAQEGCYHGDTLGAMNVATPSVYNQGQHAW